MQKTYNPVLDSSKSSYSTTHTKNTQTCIGHYNNTQILIHNIPLFSMYTLGVIITVFYNIYFAIGFLIYIVISSLLFAYLICSYCPHYGSRTSLCGYGLLAKRLTKRKSMKGFKTAFKKYIVVLFPDWFAPVIIGAYILWLDFTWIVLILFIAFILVAFVGVLYVSKSDSCNTCKLRDDCPWMSLCGR
jgi:hypothetical protein